MFIQTEATPNPATIKFIPDTPVLPSGQGPFDFQLGANTSNAPLPARLFVINGVSGVMVGADFVAVTKSPDVTWDDLKTDVLMAIMDHVVSGVAAVMPQAFVSSPEASNDAGPSGQARGADVGDPVVAQIIDLLETRIRPAVANDGGDIVFSHFEGGVVYVTMRGACAGCPSSTATLKSGIENMLKHYIPQVTEVRAA